jgi:hypothetical protein
LARTVGYLALACVIIVGAAVIGFIAARDDMLVLPPDRADAPAANRDAKADRLQVALAARAVSTSVLSPMDRLGQAYAPGGPFADPQMDFFEPAEIPVKNPPLPVSRPKSADLPPIQASYALLSDIQIAAIKDRLRMNEMQAKYWPPVEAALRSLARKMHELRAAGGARGAIAFSGDEAEQLQTAAAPLLRQLREDQKREVRALARIIGLEVVASRI